MDLLFPNIPAPYSTIFAALTTVWMLAFVLGLVVGKPNEDRTRRLPIGAKIVMLAVMIVIGGVGWLIITRGTGAEPYARWIVAGLVVGALGDLVLADVFPQIKQPLLASMGIFAVGHILYLLAIFYLRSQLYGPLDITGWLSALIVAIPALFAAALLWEFTTHNPAGDPAVNRASFFYGLLLILVVVFAAYLPIRSQVMVRLGIGAVLFAISDMLLSQVMVKQRGFRGIHDVVWLLYSTGQLLIALSIGEALRLVG
jgi:hypothetical protein